MDGCVRGATLEAGARSVGAAAVNGVDTAKRTSDHSVLARDVEAGVRRLTDGDREPHETDERCDERSVGSCSTCAVRCMLLRGASGSEATRKAELMRNEQDDDGQTERD